MTSTRFLLICSLAVFAHPGWAGQALQACQKAKKKSVDECTAAKENAKAESGSAVAAAKASTAENTGAPNLSGQLSGASSATTAAAVKARGLCDTAKKSCDSECAPGKGKPEEKSGIASEKKKCDEEIKALTDALDGSAAETADGTKKSEETKKESQGGGMQMPQMPKSEDDKKDTSDTATAAAATTQSTPAPAPAPTPAAAGSETAGFSSACSSDQGATTESCAGDLKKQCASDQSSSVCKAFTARYCGTGGGSSGGSLSTGDELKTGSGLSDSYCRNLNSQSFCGGSNTDQCASCRALKGLSALPATSITQDCSSDPSSLPTPTYSASSAAGGSSGMGGSSGGGGGLGTASTAAGSNGRATTGASPESAESKLLAGMGTQSANGGGGGGGGGGGEGSGGGGSEVSDFLAGYNIIGRAPANAKTTPGAALELNPRVTDVAPSLTTAPVFQIHSMVIKARCDAGKELNCPPRN